VGLHACDARLDVVAHEVELVDVVLLGRMDSNLRGRQSKDQPIAAFAPIAPLAPLALTTTLIAPTWTHIALIKNHLALTESRRISAKYAIDTEIECQRTHR
jgi:hypothetical protein